MNILPISQKQIERAENLYLFKKLKNSISNGESNIYGAIGEIVIYDLCVEKGINALHQPTYDYDIVIEGYKIDVKTKKTTVEPKPHYYASVAAYNTKQACDFYFFLRVNENLKHCYVLGYKSKIDFFNESTFGKEGDLDGCWRYKADCYNLEIQMLQKFKYF